MKYENAKLRQMLAAEYALGTLRGRARRRLEKLALKDAALRAEITFWETRLAEFTSDLAPVAPPPAVWLGVQHKVQTAQPKVAPLRVAERKPVPVPETAKPASLWRIGAGLATAAAVVLAVLIGQRLPLPGQVATTTADSGTSATTTAANVPAPVTQIAQAPSPPATLATTPAVPTYVALLKLPEASMQWTMSLAPERGRMNIAASGEYAKLGNHSLELWVITADGPVALGVLPVSGTAVLTMPANLGSGGDTMTLAVSLEPVGGSPTGKPTGPVLTSGAAVKAA
jgi:anti-sigma-K factor RskA